MKATITLTLKPCPDCPSDAAFASRHGEPMLCCDELMQLHPEIGAAMKIHITVSDKAFAGSLPFTFFNSYIVYKDQVSCLTNNASNWLKSKFHISYPSALAGTPLHVKLTPLPARRRNRTDLRGHDAKVRSKPHKHETTHIQP